MLPDIPETDSTNIHERFHQLSALANAGELSPAEWSELSDHLSSCESCPEIHNEYLLIDREGIPMLAATFAPNRKASAHPWDDAAARRKLFARIQAADDQLPTPVPHSVETDITVSAPWFRSPAARWAVAACLAIAVTLAGYQLGRISASPVASAQLKSSVAEAANVGKAEAERRSFAEQLAAARQRVAELEAEAASKQAELSTSKRELGTLRADLGAQDAQIRSLTSSEGAAQAGLKATADEREGLAARLKDAEAAYEQARTELVNLKAERDRVTLHLAALEADNNALVAANADQERRLKDSERYLASDRDIRELMGARQLYIADVYDIDSSSQTRRPYGRVFYTQGKSLIFYAFDLDRQPGIRNASASAFQVWGKRNSDEGKPFNLGVLYQDSATNHRWALRIDDPKQLAEINAVFVTVEPSGGSAKPTGKPFLYALLRKEVNHP